MQSEKLIFSPQLAKFLLKKGFKIVDLKAKRESDGEVVFVFETAGGFFDAIDSFKSQKAE